MTFDPVKIANAIIDVACRTQEPETAQDLMELVEQLLTLAGLPPEAIDQQDNGDAG